MLKWIGIAVVLLGMFAFAVFGFLGLAWYEPPIEASWLLQHPPSEPPLPAGEARTGPLSGTEYWVEVVNLPPDAACNLVAKRADGTPVFSQRERHASGGSGCRGSGRAVAGDRWTLVYSPADAPASLKIYESHGDGFPHIGALLLSALAIIIAGVSMAVYGFARPP